jgi:hypothetical protein
MQFLYVEHPIYGGDPYGAIHGGFTPEHCVEIRKGIELVCCGMTERLLVPLVMDPYKFHFAAVILENSTKTVNVVGFSVIFLGGRPYQCVSSMIRIPDCVLSEFPSFSFQSVEVDKPNENGLLWDVMEKIIFDRFNTQTRGLDFACTGMGVTIPSTDLHDSAGERVELALHAMCSGYTFMTILVPLSKSCMTCKGDVMSYAVLDRWEDSFRGEIERHISVEFFTIGATCMFNKRSSILERTKLIKVRSSLDALININRSNGSQHVRPASLFKPIASHYSEVIQDLRERLLIQKRTAIAMALHTRLGAASLISEIGGDGIELIAELCLR